MLTARNAPFQLKPRTIKTKLGQPDIWCLLQLKEKRCCSINKNIPFTDNSTIADPEGWYLIISGSIGDVKLTVGNLYCPNENNPEFFHYFFSFFSLFSVQPYNFRWLQYIHAPKTWLIKYTKIIQTVTVIWNGWGISDWLWLWWHLARPQDIHTHMHIIHPIIRLSPILITFLLATQSH